MGRVLEALLFLRRESAIQEAYEGIVRDLDNRCGRCKGNGTYMLVTVNQPQIVPCEECWEEREQGLFGTGLKLEARLRLTVLGIHPEFWDYRGPKPISTVQYRTDTQVARTGGGKL